MNSLPFKTAEKVGGETEESPCGDDIYGCLAGFAGPNPTPGNSTGLPGSSAALGAGASTTQQVMPIGPTENITWNGQAVVGYNPYTGGSPNPYVITTVTSTSESITQCPVPTDGTVTYTITFDAASVPLGSNGAGIVVGVTYGFLYTGSEFGGGTVSVTEQSVTFSVDGGLSGPGMSFSPLNVSEANPPFGSQPILFNTFYGNPDQLGGVSFPDETFTITVVLNMSASVDIYCTLLAYAVCSFVPDCL